jgi:lysozyme family protein
MARIEPALKFVFVNEGGFTIDQGGHTNFGITQDALNAAQKKRPKAGYPKTVEELTQDVAADIYLNDYCPAGFNKIESQRLGTLLFDMGVNAGPHQAAVLMQQALAAIGSGVTVDGDIGPKTIAAMNAADESHLIGAFMNARIAFYTHLAEMDPEKHGSSLKGWVNRAHRVPPAE